jgi:isohexenylglutaconyl-CoA hydratase
MTDYETLETSAKEGWLRINLNRPKARNALSDQMVADLLDVLDKAERDKSIRGVAFRGNGGVFCAGGDLKGFQDFLQGKSDSETLEESSLKAGLLFHKINTLSKITLMLVEGPAMAGGFGIVCAGDIVAVTRSATFALTEVTLGIPPAQIAPYVVGRLGLPVARRLMLTAARFDGVKAGEIGLADFVVDDANGLDEVEKDIRKAVQKCAPGALGTTKNLILAADTLTPEQMRLRAAKDFAACLTGPEGREGIAAFIERRKPSWAEEE